MKQACRLRRRLEDTISNRYNSTSLIVLIMLAMIIIVGPAQANTRSLSLYNVHTKENLDVVYKRDGRYVSSGIKKLQWFLRDHRRNEGRKMDRRLFDLVWELHKRTGSKARIKVISGYRSVKTNNKLRRMGRKVARNSQHSHGNAIDINFPDVPVHKMRAEAMKMQMGGVGYYRGSFVHVDTASVRAWPRMSRRQLAKLFPKGRTLHKPSNGRLLSSKGYKYAMAQYKKCRRVPCGAGYKGGDGFAVAENKSNTKSLLATLLNFGGNSNKANDTKNDTKVESGKTIIAQNTGVASVNDGVATTKPVALIGGVATAALPSVNEVALPPIKPGTETIASSTVNEGSAQVAVLPPIRPIQPGEIITPAEQFATLNAQNQQVTSQRPQPVFVNTYVQPDQGALVPQLAIPRPRVDVGPTASIGRGHNADKRQIPDQFTALMSSDLNDYNSKTDYLQQALPAKPNALKNAKPNALKDALKKKAEQFAALQSQKIVTDASSNITAGIERTHKSDRLEYSFAKIYQKLEVHSPQFAASAFRPHNMDQKDDSDLQAPKHQAGLTVHSDLPIATLRDLAILH